MANFQSNQQRGMGFKNNEKTQKKQEVERERESFRQSQGLFADSFLGVVVVVVVMSREGFIVLEDWMQKKDRNHAKTW